MTSFIAFLAVTAHIAVGTQKPDLHHTSFPALLLHGYSLSISCGLQHGSQKLALTIHELPTLQAMAKA